MLSLLENNHFSKAFKAQALSAPNLNNLYAENILWAYCYTPTNAPSNVNSNGYLRVTTLNNLCLQEYWTYSTNEYHVRQRLADNTWTEWVQK